MQVHVHMVCSFFPLTPTPIFNLVLIQTLRQIPKPNEREGLTVGWPAKETNMELLKELCNELKSKM
jgi:hypothetical protein